ncbi:MAG: aspartate-semialdehyde dehydrogenase [bacterium]|nr:aspartate-semialdehyde dehydrogenase [bacterium]MCP5042583.1 aspartate-semialdehyde dehydrogenase [bacterium]
MENVGFVGWRGMVGSVLLDRMREEGDFAGLVPEFYSTSQVGDAPPDVGCAAPPLRDAYDLASLARHEVIVTCQGGDYTKQVLHELRSNGWQGYWIDAASFKRMDADSTIVLDPVNREVIDRGIDSGIKNFIGGNCTVSLMLMGLGGLFQNDWVEWMTAMTYQSASGAGAAGMIELTRQMRILGDGCADLLDNPAATALEIDRRLARIAADESYPTDAFSVPLAGNLIPWIDSPREDGSTREEWKGHVEGNKILGTQQPIAIDGICVRVGAMRCHSQAFTVKLRKDVPLDEIEDALATANDWASFVPNEMHATRAELSPAAVTGTLTVPVGRVRKLRMGPDYLGAFSVGDQLLWGAAEPLRRMLSILRESV